MPLTKSFKEIVHLRIDRDPAFRLTLFQEMILLFLRMMKALEVCSSRLAKPN
jgi:hypothetical protein